MSVDLCMFNHDKTTFGCIGSWLNSIDNIGCYAAAGVSYGVVANVQDCDIVVSEFEL